MHRTRDVSQRIRDDWNKSLSVSSLRRLFRTSELSYKRIRKSCRHLRDEVAYEFFKQEVKELEAWAKTGEVDVCYCDEMGLSRQAVVPYGWQEVGKSEAYVPATPSGNLTTVGFLYRDNRFEGYVQQGAMSSAMLIACMDDFASRLSRKTIVVMDNASTHTSALFQAKLADWRNQSLYIQYIPAYCPELNLIECLWKQIKYHWLNPQNFLTSGSLRAALEDILTNIGTKYRISFD